MAEYKMHHFTIKDSDNTWEIVDEAGRNSVATQFSVNTSYEIGDYCRKDGKLYRFVANHNPSIWNNSDVEEVVLANELNSVKKDVAQTIVDGIETKISQITSDWLEENLQPITETTTIDKSLTIENAAAESASVGTKINLLSTKDTELNNAINANINDIENLRTNINTLDATIAGKVDNGYVEDGVAYFRSGDETLFSITGIGGGGGGSSGNDAILTVVNTTGWLAATVSQPICTLSINWSSIEDDMPTGDGMLTIRINNVQKVSKSISQGDVSISIGSYLITGTNNIKLSVSDVYGNSKTINYTVNYYSYVLSSTFDRTQIFNSSITYYYIATGAGSKVMHFKLDGVEVGTEVVTSSGRQNNYVIGTLQNGSHTLEVYFTVIINEQSIESNHLYYDLIYANVNASGTIIASSYNDFTVNQYSTCLIPFVVYNSESLTSDVTLKVGGNTVSELTNIDRSEHYWSYKAVTSGTIVLGITSGETTKTITLTVEASDIDVHAETQDLALYLSSSGRSNNEASPGTWEYGNYSAVFSNFLYDTDGWQLDNDNNTCLRVKGISRVTIPYQPFATDFVSTGKTLEFEFTTKDTIDADSAIISCYSGGVGFVITPQSATLYSNLDSVSTVFKEDEHVRISFVVDKTVDGRLIKIYINGIVSGCIQYSEIDTFQQLSPVGITVGSSDATVDLYTIRIYDNNLTRYQVLDNWIADTQDVDEMLDRYNRNNIYDEYYEITIGKLPPNLPFMIIYGSSLPEYKGDKKTVSIEFEDPTGAHPDFTAENVQIDVQGTSSAGYARKNFKCKFRNGFVINGTTVNGYQMTSNSIATKTFTFKADVASSEGANNVELVKLYNDFSPYETEPQKDNSMVRQGIDGFPMVIFHNDGEKTKFVGKYNFNNDKGTPEVFGFQSGDESWEILNNTDALALFKSNDFTTWANTFEGRYPEDNTVISNLQTFVSWVYSTDTSEATGNALSTSVTYGGVTYTTDSEEYRLAKFKHELSDYANVTALCFYYVFTELFLMIDSRAKNAFPTFFGDGKWLILPYDMDTAIGINNEGELSFGPYLEDTDTIDGADVFNGQNSVLWINLRTCFADQIKSTYNTMRNSGISYATVESRFEEHQNKWPEAIFNEDAQYKYIDPLVKPESGHESTSEYLPMLLGSKEQQRKWWLYNRFLYMDNRYETDSISLISNRIYFRANAVANLTLTPAHDTYLVVKYGSAQVQEKAKKDVPTTMVCPLSNMNDTECYIYGCENVKDLGDMVALNVSNITLSQASNLQYLKLGDEVRENTKLASLDLSSCKKLKVVDLRNCVNLTGVIDVSNCYGLEELYLTGTQVAAVNLPRGGILKKLHLPAVSALIIINNPNIEEFVYDGDYSNITTLRIENAGVLNDYLADIVIGMSDDQRIRLIDMDVSIDNIPDAYEFWRKIRMSYGINSDGSNIREPVLTGNLYLERFLSWFKHSINGVYPNLTITIKNEMKTEDNPKLIMTWNTLFSIDKTEITKVTVAHYHEADGTEDEVVDVSTTGSAGIYGYRYGTEIIIAHNLYGYVMLAGGGNNGQASFSDMTSLATLDVTYLVPYFYDNLGAGGSSSLTTWRFVNNCTNLTQLDGLESYWSAYRVRQNNNDVAGTFTTNPFRNCGLTSLDTRFLYGLEYDQPGCTHLSARPGYWNSSQLGYMSKVASIDMSSSGKWLLDRRGTGYLFYNDSALTTLVSWYADGAFKNNDFFGCTSLTRCIFSTDNGIDFTTNACGIQIPPWDYASLASIIECAVDMSDKESAVTLTLNAATFALLDADLIAKATAKNYTLASA